MIRNHLIISLVSVIVASSGMAHAESVSERDLPYTGAYGEASTKPQSAQNLHELIANNSSAAALSGNPENLSGSAGADPTSSYGHIDKIILPPTPEAILKDTFEKAGETRIEGNTVITTTETVRLYESGSSSNPVFYRVTVRETVSETKDDGYYMRVIKEDTMTQEYSDSTYSFESKTAENVVSDEMVLVKKWGEDVEPGSTEAVPGYEKTSRITKRINVFTQESIITSYEETVVRRVDFDWFGGHRVIYSITQRRDSDGMLSTFYDEYYNDYNRNGGTP